MQAVLSKSSSSLFILIIICFFLPFISISCDRQKVVRLTGVQLVTGTKVESKKLLWSEPRKIPAQPWAAIPFGVAVAGGTLGWWHKGKAGALLRAIGGCVAVASLLLLKLKLHDDMLQYPRLVFYVEFLPCYWITLWLFVIVAVLNVIGCFQLLRRKS